MEDGPTRLTWITMLAMRDRDGVVRASVPGVAHRARVTLEEAKRALVIFLDPDPQSSTETDDGRRLEKVDGGWRVINHEKYQFSTEAKRVFWAAEKARQRAEAGAEAKLAAGRLKRSKPLKDEPRAVKAYQNGDVKKAEAIAAGEA